MQGVILAGGLATRLGQLAGSSPKAMLEVQGRPFLEYQVELLKKAGITDLVICVGHLREAIMAHFGDGTLFGVRIAYSVEESPLGTGGALKNAGPLLEECFYLFYGDAYLLADLRAPLGVFDKRRAPALMMVYRNLDRYDRSNTAVEGGLVTRYSKTDKTPEMVYIDYGASIFRKEVLDRIPAGLPYPLEKVQEELARDRQMLAFEVSERFYEIGNPRGLSEFREYIGSLR
jgi:NDP-sugar pyrophosphorylase family protein